MTTKNTINHLIYYNIRLTLHTHIYIAISVWLYSQILNKCTYIIHQELSCAIKTIPDYSGIIDYHLNVTSFKIAFMIEICQTF